MRQELSILFISLEAKNPKQNKKEKRKNKKIQDTIAEEEIETTAAGFYVFSHLFFSSLIIYP